MTTTKSIASVAHRDVVNMIVDLGGRIDDTYSTPGACGYTTIVFSTAEEIAAERSAPVGDHILLYAVQVDGRKGSRADAEADVNLALQSVLASNGGPAECWWVAEDVRHDGSDCDSAVFVRPGAQYAASRLLVEHGLTEAYNGYDDVRNGQFEAPEPVVSYQAHFEALFRAVAACEAPAGTQVDDVLGEFQSTFDEIAGRA